MKKFTARDSSDGPNIISLYAETEEDATRQIIEILRKHNRLEQWQRNGSHIIEIKPGAPIGNRNAKKNTPRIRLNVLVEPDTLAWLKSNGNVGRYLDELRKKIEIE